MDAAFVGRDGKTYVFSGDQFVTYSGSTYVDAEVDGSAPAGQPSTGAA